LCAEQKFVETDLNVERPTVLRFLQKYKIKRSRTFPAMWHRMKSDANSRGLPKIRQSVWLWISFRYTFTRQCPFYGVSDLDSLQGMFRR